MIILVNEKVIKLLKGLAKSKNGQLTDAEQKKILDITDGGAINDVRRLAKKCGYVLLHNQSVEITQEGARFVLAEEKTEGQRRTDLIIIFVQLITVLVLVWTANLASESNQMTSKSVENEIYLTYPHFGAYVDCPEEVYEQATHNGTITTGIENYGKYSDEIRITVSSIGNISYLISTGNRIFSKTSNQNIGYVLSGGDKTSSNIQLDPTTTTGEFTIVIKYDCSSVSKPCDFWTAQGAACAYSKERNVWKLAEKKYIPANMKLAAVSVSTSTISFILALVIVSVVFFYRFNKMSSRT